MKNTLFIKQSLIGLLLAIHSLAYSDPLWNVSYKAVLDLPIVPSTETLSYGPSEVQFIEGWTHKSSDKTNIIFVHGGCWLSAYDLTHVRGLMTALYQQGHNVWSLEYRRTGDTQGGWPTTFDDIKLAIAKLSETNSMSLENTFILGHSAGGHLALLAGKAFPQLKGVIGLAPIYDLVGYANGNNSCQKVTAKFMGGKPNTLPDVYAVANPAVQSMHKNTFIVAGESDVIVPMSQFTQLNNVDFHSVPNAGHFDFIHPDSVAWAKVYEIIKSVQ